VLWHLKSLYFLSNPVYLWVNKFGPDFVLKFRIKSARGGKSRGGKKRKNKSSGRHAYDGDGNILHDYLEYWRPPETSSCLQAGIFTRVAIPLEMDGGNGTRDDTDDAASSASCVLNVHIETTGGPVLKNYTLDCPAADSGHSKGHGGPCSELNSNTIIAVVHDNRHVQTWQPVYNMDTQEKTLQLCGDLILSGNVGSFHPYESCDYDRCVPDFAAPKGVCCFLGFGRSIAPTTNATAIGNPEDVENHSSIAIFTTNLTDCVDIVLHKASANNIGVKDVIQSLGRLQSSTPAGGMGAGGGLGGDIIDEMEGGGGLLGAFPTESELRRLRDRQQPQLKVLRTGTGFGSGNNAAVLYAGNTHDSGGHVLVNTNPISTFTDTAGAAAAAGAGAVAKDSANMNSGSGTVFSDGTPVRETGNGRGSPSSQHSSFSDTKQNTRNAGAVNIKEFHKLQTQIKADQQTFLQIDNRKEAQLAAMAVTPAVVLNMQSVPLPQVRTAEAVECGMAAAQSLDPLSDSVVASRRNSSSSSIAAIDDVLGVNGAEGDITGDFEGAIGRGDVLELGSSPHMSPQPHQGLNGGGKLAVEITSTSSNATLRASQAGDNLTINTSANTSFVLAQGIYYDGSADGISLSNYDATRNGANAAGGRGAVDGAATGGSNILGNPSGHSGTGAGAGAGGGGSRGMTDGGFNQDEIQWGVVGVDGPRDRHMDYRHSPIPTGPFQHTEGGDISAPITEGEWHGQRNASPMSSELISNMGRDLNNTQNRPFDTTEVNRIQSGLGVRSSMNSRASLGTSGGGGGGGRQHVHVQYNGCVMFEPMLKFSSINDHIVNSNYKNVLALTPLGTHAAGVAVGADGVGSGIVVGRSGHNVNSIPYSAQDQLEIVTSPSVLLTIVTEPSSTPAVANGNTGPTDASINLITRQGLRSVATPPADLAVSNIECALHCIAFRSKKYCVVNSLKEAFVFDLTPWNGSGSIGAPELPTYAQRAPQRLEVEIPPGHTPSSLLTLDVCLMLPSSVGSAAGNAAAAGGASAKGSKGKAAKSASAPKATVSMSGVLDTAPRARDTIAGSCILSVIGDSSGRFNFSLSSYDTNTILTIGVHQAHDDAIVAILSTGDSMFPLWRLETEENSSTGGAGANHQICPVATAGSSIITVCRNGEVKVWQPVFDRPEANLKCKPDDLLSVFTFHWKLSGIFAARSVGKNIRSQEAYTRLVNQGPMGDDTKYGPNGSSLVPIVPVCSAVVDPSCVTVILSFADGFSSQWLIPGLIPDDTSNRGGSGAGTGATMSGGHIATSRKPIWQLQRHFDAVTSMNVSLRTASIVPGATTFAASPCAVGVNSFPVNNEHMPLSTVVSTVDRSSLRDVNTGVKTTKFAAIIKGNFETTVAYTVNGLKALSNYAVMVTSSNDFSVITWKFEIDTTDRVDLLSNDMYSDAFLKPVACRRITFSSPPTCGQCMPYLVANHLSNPNASTQLVWKLSCVANGIVVTVADRARTSDLHTVTHEMAVYVPREQRIVPYAVCKYCNANHATLYCSIKLLLLYCYKLCMYAYFSLYFCILQ